MKVRAAIMASARETVAERNLREENMMQNLLNATDK